ncbi:MAG TPA: hypothetical protein VM223_20000 [Planctomycetota bacterium]|nr:hypothetical protein [Planctomycetota bacterium]
MVGNRGSGIRSMVEAMRSASLGPPVFDDRRSSFWVTFRSHTLMGPQEVAWLNQFAALPLNDRQRVALVCLRLNDRITNSDYRRLNSVDVTAATRELRQLVEGGLAIQHSTKRWAYYTPSGKLRVKVPAPAPPPMEPRTDEERILVYVREHGSITKLECKEELGLSESKAKYLPRKLVSKHKLVREGRGKDAYYHLP